jgi:hypothetical protein
MRACPAAGHIIRIWMPLTGAPPAIRIECVDSACRGQGSSPVELFHQIQRLNAAVRYVAQIRIRVSDTIRIGYVDTLFLKNNDNTAWIF